VDAAVAAGHDVVALVRSTPAGTEHWGDDVTIVHGDLRFAGEWVHAVRSVDAVVHAAAAAAGDRSTQLANSVVATERLLTALDPTSGVHVVHVSSFSVYDYGSLRVGGTLNEESPLEPHPEQRDAYTEAKLRQEQLVVEWMRLHGAGGVVVRPGAIVGPRKTWECGVSLRVGRLAFVVAPRAEFRMVGVENCADAIVAALEVRCDMVEFINVIDDDLPSHAGYFRECRRIAGLDLVLIPVPWRMLRALGSALETLSRWFLGSRLRLPEILDRPRQDARWKPLRYPNGRARAVLRWQPVRSPVETLQNALADHGDQD
jgi:nucleoside-diphosphate-sugar epimerase